MFNYLQITDIKQGGLMKKWLVALLGIFMLIGACLFSACNKQQAQLTLSQESVSIEIQSDDVGSGEAVITAEVFGAKKYQLTATANGYEEFITVSTESISATKTNIIIKGVAENDSPSIVAVRVSPGNVEKYIHVDVYSEVQTISQNVDVDAVKDNFFVKGMDNILHVNKLLKIQPIKARYDISWELDGIYAGANLNGNVLTIEESFVGDYIRLKAKDLNGVVNVLPIEVPVLDKIEETVGLKWSYSQNSSFETITEMFNNFVIVPNLSIDEKYNGFVAVDYFGDLDITGYAVDSNGQITEDVVVNRYGQYNGMPLFKISTIQGKTNLNGQYTIGFKIGYADYNYEFDTISVNPIKIDVQEKVNDIIVSNSRSFDLEGTTQTLYTNYVDTASATSYGQEFHISILPTTVVDASNKYAIILTRTQAGGAIADGCPIKIAYRDAADNNRWIEVVMDEAADGSYVIFGENYIDAKTIYIKASENLTTQTAEGLRLTFQSRDNTAIATHFDLKLVKSVALEDFAFEDGDFKIDSSLSEEEIVVKKQFTLQGQTSVQGLYIINEENIVDFGEIKYISNDDSSVTFELSVSLKKENYGITTIDTYQIAHENGLVSDKMNIDVFLPLKDAVVRHNIGENKDNSVTYDKYDANTYLVNGAKTESTQLGLSHLMLKNDTTTPLSYSFNSVNGYSANAQISVGFVDFIESDSFTLEMFKALAETPTGVSSLIAYAKEVGNVSKIAYFTNDFQSIITKGVGHAFAVVSFTGKGVEGVDAEGNITLARIILIESYNSPNGISVAPDKDKNVTLYSVDSLASSDRNLARKSISIRFASPEVTYTDITNIQLVSQDKQQLMGRQTISGDNASGYTVTWQNGRYSLSNVVVTNDGISFNIEVVGTFGELAFYDTLDVHYVLRNDSDEKVYDIYTPITITIKNAQRVESLIWKNMNEEGLYFEKDDTSPQYIMVEALPSNARNVDISFVRTEEDGKFIDRDEKFVSIDDQVATGVLAVRLSAGVQKMTGYVYLMPSDAVYNNQIRYYYLDGEIEKEGVIADSMLGQTKDEGKGETYYDFLVNNAYFKSNATDSEIVENVPFSKILIKIKVVVADGSSFEYSYRIFDSLGFATINPEHYYTVMNSIDLTGQTYNSIYNFKGGLQGADKDVVVKFDGFNFAETLAESAQIRNITFIGKVNGNGFVVSTNNGQINNVNVDVDGIYPSTLNVSSGYGGGIVGTNNGTIANAGVLGLNIFGSTAHIGGLAGINHGKIENCKVEFYNLGIYDESAVELDYMVNKFYGVYVGAFVGVVANGSQISHTFAYDYSQREESVIVAGTSAGAFAGRAESCDPATTKIDYCFSVVGLSSTLFNATDVSLTNYYIGYTDADSNYVVKYVEGYETNGNFLKKGNEGFESYVNGENERHLDGLMQDKLVENVDYSVKTNKDVNGYYKSLEVATAVGEQKQAIMFAYVLKNGTADLNSVEQNALNALNTISLSQLVGIEENKNIIISSSNLNVIKVVGSSLRILKAGKTTLTLSSKQNVEIKETIGVSVVYPLSNIKISWVSAGGSVIVVRDDSTMALQKTRSRDFVVSYENTVVNLGASANSYDLVLNDSTLKVENDINNTTAVSSIVTGQSSFKVTANENSVKTKFTISPQIFEDDVLQSAVEKRFKREFSVQAIDGVISFSLSGEVLSITPSTSTAVKVEIKTTDSTDAVVPFISFNGELLVSKPDGENPNKHNYFLARDVEAEDAILTAVVSLIDSKVKDGIYTYTYNVLFSVAEEYKSKISDEMDFSVHFESLSGNSSKDWNGEFTLALTRQKFTTIDVQTRKIESSQFKSLPSGSGYIEVHTAKETTAVVAPGNSVIVQVNINPAFAYFDHVDFSYSFGEEIVLDAVNVEVVEQFGSDSTEFARRKVDGRIEAFASRLRFTPTAEEKARGVIYFKVWINTTVEKDSRITFISSFKDSNDIELSYVKSHLSISYLTQAKITVDGADTAYVAKGSTAKVQIDVLADQVVDSISLDGEDIAGVSLGKLSKPELDAEKGINTYTATLSTSVFAESGANGVFYIQAQVSRELNGNKEYKSSVATVVLVDFKVSADDITISGEKDNNFTVWQGVPKAFSVDYKLLPESYNAASDTDSQQKVAQLNALREYFLQKEFYPAKDQAKNSNYLINYLYDENGDLKFDDTNENGIFDDGEEAIPESLKNRLFYVIGSTRKSVFDPTVESPVEFNYENGLMTVTGTKISGSVEVALHTYVSAAGYTTTYEKRFTITVEPLVHEDIPHTISNAKEFMALKPDNQTSSTAFDYILTNDIVLENYTPFNTNLIRSLDGNGYTIYIKSFNTEIENTSILNLALFNNVVTRTIDGKTVPTTLKNLRVNLYNGGQITVDTNKYKEINIAGLAIYNEGIITNCEVVSFYTTGSAMGETISQQACTLHSNPTGINIKYIYGANTTEDVYHNGDMDWSSQVAGFVITNQGSITNSRVGGDKIIMVGDEILVGGKASGYSYATEQQLDKFNIIGQGNMAGFVLSNSGGYIASSFVKNIDMENKSKATGFYIAGFVGTNTSSILTSFVEGVDTDKNSVPADEYMSYAKEGSSIKSEMGYIAGFIYNNTGSIKDSYSNILIANSIAANKVYLASGFVYMNEGLLENCYSASQIRKSIFTQMNFSGVNAEGDLLANGTYINCYFFNKDNYSFEDTNDSTTESRYGTGALLIPDPSVASYFYGFAIADGETDGIWRIDEEKGITLIEANNISVSHRYVYYIEDTNYEGVSAEDEKGKYILPYSTLTFLNSSREIDTSLGGRSNPILIASAQDWIEVTGLSTSKYIGDYFDDNSIWGSYRLVNNINLSDVASSDNSVILPSSNKSFSGSLFGNGFEISGISITSDNPDVAFGLFSSIEARENLRPIVTNVNLRVDQVIAGDTGMVGALAGYIKDSNIINIQLVLNESSLITGLNFVGTLTGFAFGNNIIKNIVVENPSVTADRYSSSQIVDDYLTTSSLKEFRTNVKNNLSFSTTIQSAFFKSLNKFSYAGGVIGFVDNYVVNHSEYDFVKKDNYSINNIRINGIVRIQGQVVGGAFGLLGYQTNIRDVGITIEGNSVSNSSYILSTKYFAGGIAGQSFGSITRVFAVHQESVQDAIEDNMSAYYAGNNAVERGILNLFYKKNTNYTQKYIGGLIGFVGSGNIDVSYSRLNVASPSAQYAGGIIGGMELQDATAYQADSQLAYAPAFTKFFMNEVYATGDVRTSQDSAVNGYAGGIVGLIKGEGSRVAMLAVDAYNYFSTYDYANENYISLNKGQTSVSHNFKINSLVGRFIDDEDQIVVIPTGDDSKFSSYLTFMNAVQSSSGADGTLIDGIPSVSVYENYGFANNTVYMNLMETESYSGRDPLLTKIIDSNKMFIITDPGKYNNATTGHTYTQEGFLNSGAWNEINWGHEMSDLFPEIKYKRSTDVLFLDCYNVKDVFSKMTGNNVRVIVRGLVSEGSEEYADIVLDKDLPTGEEYPVIKEYKGKLQGGIYKTTKSGGRDDVKIIAKQNFIESTGAGFNVDGVTVEYSNGSTEIGFESGLFVNSEVVESNISNLTLIINNQVSTTASVDANKNIGLVAPVIRSTNINNLKIITNDAYSQIGTEDSILAVQGTNPPNVDKEINVGLIAGVLSQDSTISILQVNGITIKTKSNLISLSGTGFDVYNFGGYFGKTEKQDNAQEMRLNLSQIKKIVDDPTDKSMSTIHLTDLTNDLTNKPEVHLGGYIGNASGLGYVGTQDGEPINTAVGFVIDGSGDVSELYTGGVFGNIDCNSPLTFNGKDSIIQTKLTSSVTTTSLYAGGFTGCFENAKLSLYAINKINLTVANKETPTELSQQEFETDYMHSEAVEVTGNAYVGIVVGKADSQFEFKGKGGSESPTLLNAGGQPIKISAKNVYFGSVLGQTNAERTKRVDEESQPKRLYSTNIVGKIYSKAQVAVESTTDVVLGGTVGLIEGQDATGTMSDVQIGETADSMIRFDGAFYTNAKSLSAGGILGKYTSSKDTAKLSIEKTSFGGAVKVYGANSNSSDFIFGGTLGNTEVSNVEKIEIENNYNYGDVFVEYGGTLSSLSAYTFGGVVGNATGSGYNINGNYSLTTTHNSRYSDSKNTVHAIIGSGTVVNASQANYYNHAVVLANDYSQGIDAGYQSAYSKASLGYCGQKDAITAFTMITTIKNGIGLNESDLVAGHKLNPSGYNADGKLENVNAFNGIRYYKLSSLENNEIVDPSKDGAEQKVLTNIALIGDGSTIDFTINDNDTHIYGLAQTLEGYSFISGVAINANLTIEKAKSTDGYGVVAGSMDDNSQLYAINVYGNFEVGTDSGAKPTVSGLVGSLTSGKIYDCSTDLDIVYRATSGGHVNGLTSANGIDGLIENCYVAGSIKTMTNASVYALVGGAGEATINNSYTIAKVDWNDYTDADEGTGSVNIIPTESTTVYYDQNGIDYALTAAKGTAKTYAEFKALLGEKWICNDNFNYGYPTLRYGYLKRSSYANVTFTAKGTTGRDYYIKNGTYTRLANGAEPNIEDDKEDFFMIPNISVLQNRLTEISNVKYALLYDIDLNNTNYKESWTRIDLFNGTLDGRGKTIRGLTDGLFNTINSGIVRNLRLTDVNMTTGGALAKTILWGAISNMTLSGHINAETGSGESAVNYKVGALCNIAQYCRADNNAGIDTITNMINVTIKPKDTTEGFIAIGGIIGESSSSELSYCSNYGPITAQTAAGSIQESNVGGLVGYAYGGVKIIYSYNATSVLNNYASSTTLSSVARTAYTGGLVGGGNNLTISNSYNSGMIKSGNKSNSKGSYAGGIIGYGNYNVAISACYNEGTVEALGVNPTFKWAWENNASTGNQLALTLRTNSDRNVYAYAIGYFADDTSSIADSEARMRSTTPDETDETIKNNGAYLANNIVIKYWPWSTIKNTLTDNFNKSYTGSKKWTSWTTGAPDQTTGISWPIPHWHTQYKKVDVDLSKVTPETSDNPNVSVLAWNELNMPTSFILTNVLKIKVKMEIEEEITLEPDPSDITKEETGYIDEYYAYDYSNIYSDYYDKFDSNTDGKERTSNLSSSNVTVSNRSSDIVKETRSAEEKTLDNIKKVAIDGKEYYIADSNNINTIFNAGIYQADIQSEFDAADLPYFNNKDYYSISAQYNGSDISASITSVETTSGKTKVSYSVYSDSQINGTVSATISLNYEEKVTFDTSAMSYVYVDDYSIGIVNISPKATELAGYKIKTGDETEYTNVIKLSKDASTYNVNNQPADNSEDLLYLAKAEDGMYIFIPNATLTTSEGEEITVNKIASITGALSAGGFATNVQSIFDLLAGKTFYARENAETSDKKYISFTASGEGEYTFTASGIYSGSTTIDYGGTVDVIPRVEYFEIIETQPDPETLEPVNVVVDQGYTISISGLGKDALGIAENGAILISYDHDITSWGKRDDMDSITIDGKTYSVFVENNKFVFRSETIVAEDESTKANIENYFNSFVFIVNESKQTTIYDHFTTVTSMTAEETIAIGTAGNILIKTIVDKDNYDVENHYGLTIETVGNNRVVSTPETHDSLNYQELNGVKIYKGSITVSYTQSYEKSISNLGVQLNNNVYSSTRYELNVYKDGTSIGSYNGTNGAGSHYQSTVDLDDLTGNIKVVGRIYGYYEVDTANDGGDFGVAVKHNGTNYYLEGKVDVENKTFVLDDSFSQLMTMANGQKALVTKSVVDLSYTEEGGTEHVGTMTTYSVEGVNFLAISTIDGNTKIYKTFKDDGSEYQELTEFSGGDNTPVYFKVGEIVYSIMYGNLIGMKSLDYFKNAVIYSSDSTSSDSTYTDSGKTVLVLDPAYTDIGEINYTFNGESYSKKTYIESANYEWNQFEMPTYSAENKNLSFGSSNWTSVEVDDGTGAESLQKLTDYLAGKDYLQGSQSLCKLDMILRPAKDINEVGLLFKLAKSKTSTTEVLVTDATDPKSIILDADISFKNIGEGFGKNKDVNVIGNGYYISYYGNSFYNGVYGSYSFVRDVNFLGETYDKVMFAEGLQKSVKMQNISLYGSVVNNSKRIVLIEDADMSLFDAVLDLNNFKTYVCVNSLYDKPNLGIALVEADVDNATNYGVVVAKRGEDGSNGLSASSYIIRDGRNGGDGEKGVSIKATLEEGTMINKGILYAGNGGNGGAGGTSYRGEDLFDNSNSTRTSAGTEGAGGAGGSAGTISGFDSDENLATGGKAGLDGTKSRDGFGSVKTKTDVKDEYASCIWIVKYNKEGKIVEQSVGKIDDVFEHMFGITAS